MDNGERRTLEEEDLRSAEEDLLVVAMVDTGGGVRTLGREWARMGFDRGLGESATLAGIFCDDDLPRVKAAFQRLEHDPIVAFDARLRADGTGERATWLRFRATREGEHGDVRLVGIDITDLKRAIRRSARKLDLLEAAIEHAQAGIAITDERGLYVEANAWYRQKTGAGRDLRGVSVLESVAPEHHALTLEVQRRFFAGEPEPTREWAVKDLNGVVSELRCESVMIRTTDGTPYGLSTLTDISAERRRDARLQMFGKLLESAPVILWALDKDGRFTHAEGKGLAAHGAKPGDWVGRDALEDWKGTPACDDMKRALAGEEFSASLSLPGSIDYNAWYVPLRAIGGEPDGMIGLALDVTKDRAIEADLREKLETVESQRATIELFIRALRSAPVILWTIDKQGNNLVSEGRGVELLGFEPGQVPDINAFEMYRGTPIEHALHSALEGREVAVTTEPAPGVFFDNWIMPLRKADGVELQGALGLSIHATERVQSERDLREKLAVIGRQNETIRSLATPIINVWDEVLVLPVIGTVDSRRTADMMDTLLAAIVREKARFAIVDLTGVEIVDTLTADHLIKLFKSAKVLGVDGVLCGIQPAVAQTVISLGVELAGVRTMRTLQNALRWCMAARERQRSVKTKVALPAAE